MSTKKIAVIVGSLRKGSFNKAIANALIQLAPKSLTMQLVSIAELPLYNQDDDNSPPKESVAFKQKIQDAEGFLFATPEYNRSIPGVLKNALDIASRPYGKSAWEGKPGAIISASPGAVGGFGANHHLRQALVFLNVPCMAQPEAYIGNVSGLLDEQGNVKNDDTKKFLQKFIDAFATWVERNSR